MPPLFPLLLLSVLFFAELFGHRSSPPHVLPPAPTSLFWGGEGGVLGLMGRDGGVGGVPRCSSHGCGAGVGGVGGAVGILLPTRDVPFGPVGSTRRWLDAAAAHAAATAGGFLAKKWWRV